MVSLLKGLFGPKTEQLIEAFDTSDSSQLEIAIQRVLKRSDAFEHLCSALKSTSPWIRRGAAMALMRSGDIRAFEELAWILPHGRWDIDPASEAVIEAVGRLADGASDSDRRHAADRLAKLLADEMLGSLYFTVPHALARLGDRRSIPHLLGLATSRRADEFRIEAATLLGHILENQDRDEITKAIDALRDRLTFERVDREDTTGTERVLKIMETTAARLDARN
jgi:hypothetical protein